MASRPMLADAALEIVRGMDEETILSLKGQRGKLRIGALEIEVLISDAGVPNPDPFGFGIALPPLFDARLVLHARIEAMRAAEGDRPPMPDHVVPGDGSGPRPSVPA